jgi:fructokinase
LYRIANVKLSRPAGARNIPYGGANDNLSQASDSDVANERMRMIVSAGEALVDLLPTVDRDGEPAFRAAVGGSPFNVAVALGRLGVRAAFLGAVSSDAFGDRILQTLRESGAGAGLVTRVDRPTPLAVATREDADARYAFYDSGTAARGMTLRELKALPDDTTIFHFGSMALAAEPAASTLIARAKAARGDNRLVSIDPNVRPAIAPSAPDYLRNMEQAMEIADIVKLSRTDLDWLRPGLAPREFARERLEAGAALIVVTGGADGALAFMDQHTCEMPAMAVTVADTIGAGDAFAAGLLAQLATLGVRTHPQLAALTRDELQAALAFATMVAALTCTRAGADPPWKHELVAVMPAKADI